MINKSNYCEYNNSLVESGDMIGSLAAQHRRAFYTNDTKYISYIQVQVTGMQGVPRLRELISISKQNKTPTMDIYIVKQK